MKYQVDFGGGTERMGRAGRILAAALRPARLAALLAGLLAGRGAALPAFTLTGQAGTGQAGTGQAGAPFPAALQARVAGLAAAATPAELEAARMDLAALYLAHLMLPEGRSVLAGVDDGALDAAGRARLGVLSAAFTLMAGQALPPDAPDGPLAPGAADWPDVDFWAAMAAIRAGNADGIRAHLAQAADRLGAYPPVFAEACLPLFLRAALDVQDWTLAQRIAERFDDHPALKASPVYSYLLGRAALGVQRRQKAYVAFRAAAAGQGPYAQRALLALIDLGLEDHSLPPENARKLLDRVLSAWRGGEIELDALRRLAQVDRETGDWPGMLEALGRIGRDFPQSADAGPAKRQAQSLIASYYPYAISSGMPLEQVMAMHRRITPLYRLDPVFETQSEALADHLLELGASALAAAEFARIHDTLAVVAAHGLWPVAPERMAHLKLREAEALAQGGQYDLAGQALAATGTPAPADVARQAALELEIYAALGAPEKVLAVSVPDPGAADLRRLARAAMERKDWTAAETGYRRLRETFPRAFGGTDAIDLMLAALRAGDIAAARQAAADLPAGAEGKALSALAAGLLAPLPPVAPLRRAAAQTRIDAAAAAITRIDSLAAEKPAP